MEVGPLFSGNALAAVDPAGRVRLPRFAVETLARRGDGRRIVFGAHPSDPCLTAYEPAHRSALLGQGPARRLFGFSEEAELDARGRVTLPPMMRWKGRIEALALIVGAGGTLEIWDPELALDAGDPALREMAEYRLRESTSHEEEEGR